MVQRSMFGKTPVSEFSEDDRLSQHYHVELGLSLLRDYLTSQ